MDIGQVIASLFIAYVVVGLIAHVYDVSSCFRMHKNKGGKHCKHLCVDHVVRQERRNGFVIVTVDVVDFYGDHMEITFLITSEGEYSAKKVVESIPVLDRIPDVYYGIKYRIYRIS